MYNKKNEYVIKTTLLSEISEAEINEMKTDFRQAIRTILCVGRRDKWTSLIPRDENRGFGGVKEYCLEGRRQDKEEEEWCRTRGGIVVRIAVGVRWSSIVLLLQETARKKHKK